MAPVDVIRHAMPVLIAFALGCATGSVDTSQESPETKPEVPVPLIRTMTQPCSIPPAPILGAMSLKPVIPADELERPLWFGVVPGQSDLYLIAQQAGSILAFDSRSFELVGEVLNINVLRNNNEEGLLGVAFHPDFEQNGRAFVHYSASNPRRSVIAEYQRSTNERLKLDATTERILMEIEQPFGNHNGGDLRFGPDGYLYIALGDGGSAGDPLYHGQNRESRLGTILRIDIDRPDEACNTPYGIPDDNPFAPERCMPGQENNDAPEIYAWGFRNVWRMSFDRSSGALYAADVGQDMFEEVNRVKLGGNYGWNQTEGHVCFTEPCDTSLFEAPLLTYSRQVGRSITGGFVYRGSRWPSLWGQYVFGDFESGKIWSIDPDAVDPEQTLLVDSGERITSFGENSAGEIFVVTFDSGVLTFDAPSHSSASPPLPPTLLETGCFANVATYQLHPSVIPYSVNSPLWSDGLLKERHVALPVDTKAKVEANGLIALPWARWS